MTSQPREEVAVFVDLENLRYSMLNLHGVEPDVGRIVEKIRTYGRPTVMRAYADFSEHEPVRGRLQIAGIEAINVPVKRINRPGAQNQVERVKNAADMWLALDAIAVASDADSSGIVKTFMLVTGDADYIKLVTQIRNRYGQRVVVCGVPGSTSRDLISAADDSDPVEVPEVVVAENIDVKRAIVSIAKRGPAPMEFWTIKVLDRWAQDPRNNIPGTPKQRRDVLNELVQDGVLVKELRDYTDKSGQTRRTMEAKFIQAKAVELGYI